MKTSDGHVIWSTLLDSGDRELVARYIPSRTPTARVTIQHEFLRMDSTGTRVIAQAPGMSSDHAMLMSQAILKFFAEGGPARLDEEAQAPAAAEMELA